MRGLYFCIRTPCAGRAQTRAGAAPVSLFILFRKGRRAAKRPALSAAARPKRKAGRKPAGRGRGPARRKEKAAGQGKGGGTPRKLAGASARSRAVKRPARGREESRAVKRLARGKRRTGKKNCAVCSPDPVVGGRKPPAEPGSNGQQRTGSDAVRGGIVHFSRSFGERSHKPPFFAPFGHPVVISER